MQNWPNNEDLTGIKNANMDKLTILFDKYRKVPGYPPLDTRAKENTKIIKSIYHYEIAKGT